MNRIKRMEYIAASLCDQETPEFGFSDAMRCRMERKEELSQRKKSQLQQCHLDNAKNRNAYGRLYRKGRPREQKDESAKKSKAYYEENKDDINEKRRKKRAEEPRTIEDIEDQRVKNNFYWRRWRRSFREELKWVSDEADRRDFDSRNGQGPTVSDEEFTSRKAKIEALNARIKKSKRESAARSRQKKLDLVQWVKDQEEKIRRRTANGDPVDEKNEALINARRQVAKIEAVKSRRSEQARIKRKTLRDQEHGVNEAMVHRSQT